jgi:hypothetical protein
VGAEVISKCDARCLDYSSSACDCDLVKFLEGIPDNKKYVMGVKGIGGEQRLKLLERMLEGLQKQGVLLRVLSTSSGHINSTNWATFIARYLELASPILANAFPIERIITLDDPGDDIAADKGGTCEEFLTALRWSPHNGILVDDSPTNIATAEGKVDWLQVTPREGIAADALQFLAKRARVGNRSVRASPITKNAVPKKKDRVAIKKTKRVSIVVTQTSAYCGGAAPTEEILKQLQVPRPLPNWKLLFYRADVKLQERRGKPESAVTNENGLIRISLEPLPNNLVYCVVEESKGGELIVPPDHEHTKYDKKCLERQHSSCDFVLTTANTTATINFPSYCTWGTPCVHYTGSLPS